VATNSRHTARIEGILFETDTPELVLARDAAGTVFLSLLVERSGTGDRFLCVPVSPGRIANLRDGRLDLREALVKGETGTAYSASFFLDDKAQSLRLEPLAEIPSSWLPESGFLLSDFLPESLTELQEMDARSKQLGTSLGVLVLDPPEAYSEAKIDSYRLAEGLRLFQSFVRYAYARAVAGGSALQKAMLGSEDAYVLQVLPQFSHGSFRIHFQSKWKADLGGATGVGIALSKVDEITQYLDNPDLALPVLRNNSGHVIGAYKNLLHFVAKEKTPIAYEWSEPGAHEPKRRRISVDAAQRMYEILETKQELSSVTVTHVGIFTKLNTDGSWVLRSGKRYIAGKTATGMDDLLAGAIFETQQYRIVCTEVLEEGVGSGSPKTRLELKEKPTPA